ncbi:MAG: PTS fructose transporter subunit IIB [Pseudomonadota bacterium]
MKLVAVTACTTGIAHTYMAAEKLEEAAKQLKIEIKVETQGAMGIENELTSKDIQAASLVLLATDVEIEGKNRFTNIKVVTVPIGEVILDPKAVLQKLSKQK